MPLVFVFSSCGRFASSEEFRRFVEPSHNGDGELVPSPFMLETGCEGYEPACVEAGTSAAPVPLSQLLRGASYSEQRLASVPDATPADAVLCVYAPNVLSRPERSSMTFHGAIEYQA